MHWCLRWRHGGSLHRRRHGAWHWLTVRCIQRRSLRWPRRLGYIRTRSSNWRRHWSTHGAVTRSVSIRLRKHCRRAQKNEDHCKAQHSGYPRGHCQPNPFAQQTQLTSPARNTAIWTKHGRSNEVRNTCWRRSPSSYSQHKTRVCQICQTPSLAGAL